MKPRQIRLEPAGMLGPGIPLDDPPPGAGAVGLPGAGVGAGGEVLGLDVADVGGLALAVVEPAEEAEAFPFSGRRGVCG